MSDKIQVPLEFHNRHHVEVFAHFLRREARERPDAGLDFVAEQVEAALPPEYVRGEPYRIQCKGDDPAALPPVGFWDGSAFIVPTFTPGSVGGYRRALADDVTKVEPLRVLADDEIAVKRPSPGDFNATDVRIAARRLRENAAYTYIPAWMETHLADALDAEATS